MTKTMATKFGLSFNCGKICNCYVSTAMQYLSVTAGPRPQEHPTMASAIAERRRADLEFEQNCDGYREGIGQRVSWVLFQIDRLWIGLENGRGLSIRAAEGACRVDFPEGVMGASSINSQCCDTIMLSANGAPAIEWIPSVHSEAIRGRTLKKISYSPQFVVVYFSGGIVLYCSYLMAIETSHPILYWFSQKVCKLKGEVSN
jgi:hypothetical protein